MEQTHSPASVPKIWTVPGAGDGTFTSLCQLQSHRHCAEQVVATCRYVTLDITDWNSKLGTDADWNSKLGTDRNSLGVQVDADCRQWWHFCVGTCGIRQVMEFKAWH